MEDKTKETITPANSTDEKAMGGGCGKGSCGCKG